MVGVQEVVGAFRYVGYFCFLMAFLSSVGMGIYQCLKGIKAAATKKEE